MPRKESKRSSKGLVVKKVGEDVPSTSEMGRTVLIKSEFGHHFSSLFRPLKRKAKRDKQIIKWTWRFDEEYEFPRTILKFDELEYEFRVFEELGEDDLKVFLRLVQVAGVGSVVLDPWMEEYEGVDGKIVKQLGLFSSCGSKTENSRTLPVVRSEETISYNAFLGPILKGRVGKTNLKHLRDSLRRLASTTVFVTAKRKGKPVREMGSNLVSFAIDYETGRFLVAVNPFVANAILGNPLGGYRPLIDSRVFELKGTEAVLLSWLSAWLLPGRSGKISLDKLEEHIYGDRAEDQNRRKWRRKKLRQALKAISNLKGWEVKETSRRIFEIRRLAPQSSKSERSETSPRTRASSAS